jgi:hypothetical protein
MTFTEANLEIVKSIVAAYGVDATRHYITMTIANQERMGDGYGIADSWKSNLAALDSLTAV